MAERKRQAEQERLAARKRQAAGEPGPGPLALAAEVFDGSGDAIVLTDRSRTIVAANAAYARMTGLAPDAVAGRELAMGRDGIDTEPFHRQIGAQLDGSDHWQGAIATRRHDGAALPVWLSLTAIRDGAGQISHYLAILSAVTDRKKSEEATRRLAEHDFLTDLPNRVLLRDRLGLALAAARRKQTMLAVLFLDLDRFKQVNDRHGHAVGDALLQDVAARLLKCVRGVDTVSRQGGDEFVIVLADIGGIDQAAHIAAAVLQAIGQPFYVGELVLHISTTIGVSIYPDDGGDFDALIKTADIAMYHAKESGRNSFQFFNAAMNSRIVERTILENSLRVALAQGQFLLVFQPEMAVDGDAPVAVEALLRWRHPQLGLLPPERFLRVAEECGLMLPIGDWVLHEACRCARRWHDAGHALAVAVNLSAPQLLHDDVLRSVRAALRASGLPAACLELELTEAILMKGGAGVTATLAALRALGVRITLDDFGTGYTRLGYLNDCPIDKLKIDQSFMAGIAAVGPGAAGQAGSGDGAVVAAIIGMAHSLGMQAIAEGVETPAQLAFLRSRGCDQYQGYLADALLAPTPLGRLLAGSA